MDLHERAHPVEPRVALHTADRPDVAGHDAGRLLAPARHDGDVRRQAREGICREIRRAARHIDAAMCPRGARSGVPRLADRLVRDATRVDHRDLRTSVLRLFDVAVAEEALTDLVSIGMRDLAAEKADGERRHGPDATRPRCEIGTSRRTDPPPNHRVSGGERA